MLVKRSLTVQVVIKKIIKTTLVVGKPRFTTVKKNITDGLETQHRSLNNQTQPDLVIEKKGTLSDLEDRIGNEWTYNDIVSVYPIEDRLDNKVLSNLLKQELNINKVDRKSTRLNSSHVKISYAVFCLKKKKY